MNELKYCRYEKRGSVAYVTIARPEVLNALHTDAHFELATVWDDFATDAGLRVAVLTGEGSRAFCAGRDLKDRARPAASGGPDRPPTGGGGLTHRFDLAKPVIARVNGFALGGGMEIALACDIIVAADHAEFGLPEPRRGLIAGSLGVHRLPRQLPLKVAMGYLLTGRHLSASRAFELGLVNQVVPLSALDEAVDAWVADILPGGPAAIAATKRAALAAGAPGAHGDRAGDRALARESAGGTRDGGHDRVY